MACKKRLLAFRKLVEIFFVYAKAFKSLRRKFKKRAEIFHCLRWGTKEWAVDIHKHEQEGTVIKKKEPAVCAFFWIERHPNVKETGLGKLFFKAETLDLRKHSKFGRLCTLQKLVRQKKTGRNTSLIFFFLMVESVPFTIQLSQCSEKWDSVQKSAPDIWGNCRKKFPVQTEKVKWCKSEHLASKMKAKGGIANEKKVGIACKKKHLTWRKLVRKLYRELKKRRSIFQVW